MTARKQESPLAHVQRLIRKLPVQDRKTLIAFLATFPDSGIRSLSLRDEFETLKKFGTRLGAPEGDAPSDFLFEIVFIKNLVSIQIGEVEILRTVFFPENFKDAFPKSPNALSFANYLSDAFTEEIRANMFAGRRERGIQETHEEFATLLDDFVKSLAEKRMKIKADHVADQISAHLPGMVGDMFGAAYKAQVWVDTQNLAKALGEPDTPELSLKTFKKLVLASYWRSIRPHLNIERSTRTKPEWRSDDVLRQYARLVNDRKTLAGRMKDVYDDCEHEPGWMNDLNEDSTFQRLAVDAPQEILDFAMKLVADDGASPRQREPVSIACEMARRELDLPEQEIETLRGYHQDGSKLLKKDRSQGE